MLQYTLRVLYISNKIFLGEEVLERSLEEEE